MFTDLDLMAEQSEKRKRGIASKYKKDYVFEKPGSYCPGCNTYVKSTDDGIVCSGCAAYWHYKCANISEKDVVELGKNDFYCVQHQVVSQGIDRDKKCDGTMMTHVREENMVDLKDTKNIDEESVNLDDTVVSSRVSQYILNKEADRKKKLKNMNRVNDVVPKDKGNQFTVRVNTVTYFIITQTISVLGLKYGIKVKRLDVDLSGNPTRDLFEATMIVDGVTVPISITCFHTTCNILLQLMGSRGDDEWTKKVKSLERFAEVIMVEMIESVESVGEYENIKNCLILSLSDTHVDSRSPSSKLTSLVLAAASTIKTDNSNDDDGLINKKHRSSDSEYEKELSIVETVSFEVNGNGLNENDLSGVLVEEILNENTTVSSEENEAVVQSNECGSTHRKITDLAENHEREPMRCPSAVSVPVISSANEAPPNQLVLSSNSKGKNLSPKNLQQAVSVLNRHSCKDNVHIESSLFNIIMKLKSKSIER